ncbi:MAG: hypothetical protein PUF07_06450, partial [Bacteroidales bacterium]|nr:hypothetical protein [Bacteroidales bacterium]
TGVRQNIYVAFLLLFMCHSKEKLGFMRTKIRISSLAEGKTDGQIAVLLPNPYSTFTSPRGNKTRRPLVLYVKKVRYLPM